jgi:hypothetical protein
MEYRVSSSGLFLHGKGKTIDFSSTGIAFTTEDPLPVGDVEISVEWPAKINGQCAMRFLAFGRVVRSGNGRVAVAIHTHEFKTRAA